MRKPFVLFALVLGVAGAAFAFRPSVKIPPVEVEQIAGNPALPNVLVIGDSISIGWTPYVRADLENVANVHHTPHNSKSTAFGLKLLDHWLAPHPWAAIVFNFGIHDLTRTRTASGWAGPIMVNLENYRRNLAAIARRLTETNACLIFATTTPIPSGSIGRDEHAERDYNIAAREVLSAFQNIAIVDLASVPAEQLPSDVHFTEAGHRALATPITQALRGHCRRLSDAAYGPSVSVPAAIRSERP